MSQSSPLSAKNIVLSVVAFIVLVTLCVGGAAGCKEYGRYQKRADAVNKTKIVKQEIKTMQQRAQVIHAQEEVTRATANQRFIEATGIRKAQDEIQATLTDRYLQHEAIQAQKAIATSGRNNSIIYVPSGSNGTPLVQDISRGTLRGNDQNTAP